MTELLCEQCRRLVETETCPYCGSTETRKPESGDYVYLAEMPNPYAATLEAALDINGIDFRRRIRQVGKRTVLRAYYIRYDQADDAWTYAQKLWEDPRPSSSGLSVPEGPGLFDADEIEQMEASQLDGMNLQELVAYKDKIMRTLKEIRAQEQRWKLLSNRLLDMKEETEYLIDDLS